MKRYIPKTILERWWVQDCILFLIAPSVVGIVAVLNTTGIFQHLEWSIYDAFFQLRPSEPEDSRVVVVTIDDEDFAAIKRWPISDAMLASLLTRLQQENARVVGLDMYRDLAVAPGNAQLEEVFSSMPNLIGVQKILGEWSIEAPKTLQEKGQVAMVDVLEDSDFRVRRGLISAQVDSNIHLTLGPRVALEFLDAEGVTLQTSGTEAESVYLLGKAQFRPLNKNDGGYVGINNAGYQVLLNFRGQAQNFRTIALRDVLSNNIPKHFFRDRMVFIGTTAHSLYDFFSTPYSKRGLSDSTRMPGVFIHANLASQIVSGALDGRAFIQTVPNPLEWAWTLLWSIISVFLSGHILKHGKFFGVLVSYSGLIIMVGVLTVMAASFSYLLFLGNIWMPIVPGGISIFLTGLAMIGFYGQRLHQLAYKDGLTQVANRRYFDQILTQRIQFQGHLSIILCDVDHFKLYNDTYGHLAGDACLEKVATAIKAAVRRSDSVARYGGEEFVVMLPGTDLSAALQIAERVVAQVYALQLPHASSKTAEYVTLSCGVTSVFINDILLQRSEWNAEAIIGSADSALYHAKESGRNRAVSQNFRLLPTT